MCRWLSYCGRPLYLESLLFEPENSLIQQALHARHASVTTNGDGFGVGWYGERNVPGTYHDNFQLADPLPELGDWLSLVQRVFEKKKPKEELSAEGRYSHP
jgi:hypothetical protein